MRDVIYEAILTPKLYGSWGTSESDPSKDIFRFDTKEIKFGAGPGFSHGGRIHRPSVKVRPFSERPAPHFSFVSQGQIMLTTN